MRYFLTTIFLLSGITASAASKTQIAAALNATAISNVTSVTEDSTQERCFGCRVITIKGQGQFGEAWQQFLVQEDGPNSFSTQILSQSR